MSINYLSVFLSVLAARTKILYVDDDYVVMYTCDVDGDLQQCLTSSVQVVVYSRTLTPVTEEKRRVLRQIVTSACQQPGDFVEITHDGLYCYVRSFVEKMKLKS